MIAPWRKAESRWAFWLLMPALVGIGLFTALPMIGSLALSFTQWDLLGVPTWVGMANYRDLFADPLFYKVMGQTAWFSLVYVATDLVLAMGLAMALNQNLRAMGLFRILYFLPVVTSMVAGAILWSWLLDPRSGLLNLTLGLIGLGPVRWLQDPQWALATLVGVNVWKYLGYDMLLFLAGLQAVPGHLLEAASLDGANAWQRFRYVIMPAMRPTVVLVAILATIRATQTFDTVFLLTEGGPQRSTSIVGYWLYQNAFTYFKLGKASALAYLVFLALLGLSLVQWRYYRRQDGEES